MEGNLGKVLIVVVLVVAVFWGWVDYNAEAITAVATVALVLVAFLQIRHYEREAKKRSTVDMIRQFQTDRLLDEKIGLIQKKIIDKDDSGNVKTDDKGDVIYDPSRLQEEDRLVVKTVLGIYDSMALSVIKRITEEDLMEAEFDLEVKHLVDFFLPMGERKNATLYTEDEAKKYFPCLVELYERWHGS